ncbi:metallophosphoesterase family protein [Fictibacillus nanhaiensis]|uniref:metallophosphoesterase family protein n=1 Tax=Fictibacillus nanhaiensis TaxID=742169 RepID=UPI00203CAD9A|nr:metallophosphoesterase family protein [Fictibacillus nanhaiensis]MCM3733985.1 metallophosphoesterase family protein [Fictibacillus nanhaiensis]
MVLSRMKYLSFYEAQNDFIGFGHHHILHDFKSERTHFVNPGSLGCHSVAEARYALVYCSEWKIRVEFKSVPYARTRLFKAYKELNVPAAAFLMEVFHHTNYSD